ncbi:hypothetical protein EMB92_02590 [Bifidobacterium callitrichos]|uniref:Uncharacterized protein n=1 Tax=Bifidobacterium callitrichos TaxID=762209 RepID=A0A5M9ZES7_9BIFI|nr:hypothetical protein [Bifidobacterium callitrichos]KAA8817469.1 hypothetical protein EMB92_02590 [Bifidobacterium callitrichos]
MSSLEITVTVIVVIVSVVIGLYFGLIPLRVEETTEEQNKYSQVLGIIGVGLVIVLIFTKQDFASWAAIFAMLAGVLIAKIPPLHRWGLEQFPWMAPAKPKSPLKRAKPAGKGAGGKKRK